MSETPQPDPRPNLYGLDEAGLAAAIAPLDPARFRARQVAAWLYARDALDPLAWTDLARPLRTALSERFAVERPQVVARFPASDGTLKAVLALPGGGQVEAVAIPAEGRMTFCISSQVGCAYGCAYCMTARLGFGRHLAPGEIVGQVAALIAETGADRASFNIVFMGMGEPLHNVDNVLAALRLLTAPAAFGLGPRRITVSTVGLPKGIARLAAEPVVPRLAVSLAAADPDVRASLMPVAKAVGLDELADAIRAFGTGKRDDPTVEVVLLEGINDAPRLADALATFARRAGAKVNLIEFNETPDLPFRAAREERIQHFLRVLSAAGVVGTVRRSRGRDAFAACGQLAFLQKSP